MGRRLHPNVLKLRKQKKRMKRAYLENIYSRIHVPRKTPVSVMPEDGAATAGLVRRNMFHDPWLETLFPGKKSTSVERKLALERADEEKLIAMTADPDVCDFHTIGESAFNRTRATIVFNRKKDRVFIIEVAFLEHLAKKSKVYSDYNRALFDFQHHRVSWREIVPLPSLVLPRRG